MAYNTALDEQLQHLAADWPAYQRKKMFGGTGHFSHGHMVAGVSKDRLMLRADAAMQEDLLRLPWCHRMEMSGRIMKAWVVIDPEGWDQAGRLQEWLSMAKSYVDTLPPKS